MNNNTSTNNNNMNTTLTEAVKALYLAHPRITVIQIMNDLRVNQTHLKTDYRKVYNTLKRINGSSKAPKVIKTEKASIVLDLTQTPEGPAIPGVVVASGKK